MTDPLGGVPVNAAGETPSVAPAWRVAWRFWLKLGCISFGGPAGQIALMHQELVERRRWIGERRFLHALNYCCSCPAPRSSSWRPILAG